jgi:hypothetical protein
MIEKLIGSAPSSRPTPKWASSWHRVPGALNTKNSGWAPVTHPEQEGQRHRGRQVEQDLAQAAQEGRQHRETGVHAAQAIGTPPQPL